MTELVGYLMLFVGVGVFFLFFHLMMGKMVRPNKPDADKLTIYECGEPTIGSAWIQFDLRFYVVALLFVIFDVEVAFFFPWAVVFGKANALSRNTSDPAERLQRARELDPRLEIVKEKSLLAERQLWEARPASAVREQRLARINAELTRIDTDIRHAARQLAWLAFWDIVVFFAVLLVGFAYLWRRGDLDWVRSVAAEKAASGDRLAVPSTNGGLIGGPVRAIPAGAIPADVGAPGSF